ncbi:hypothetical protein K3495_g1918 [Podosphaera aphanis]|nr:hypothetical protein K3495_g1918 [Podosphaera aphanis]
MHVKHPTPTSNTSPVLVESSDDSHPALEVDKEVEENKNVTWAYPVTTFHVHPGFLEEIKEAYQQDKQCCRTINLIKNNEGRGQDGVLLPFEYAQGLLFAKKNIRHEERRVVIPNKITPVLFDLARSQLGHIGFNRVYQKLSDKFYVFNLGKELRLYLLHFRECTLNATRRHQPHGSLQPILSPPSLFHTISIDFVLALLRSVPDGFDCLLTVTEKLSKVVTMIPGNVN